MQARQPLLVGGQPGGSTEQLIEGSVEADGGYWGFLEATGARRCIFAQTKLSKTASYVIALRFARLI